MKKKSLIYLTMAVALIVAGGVGGYHYLGYHDEQEKKREQKAIKQTYPIAARKHYIDYDEDQELANIKTYAPKNKKDKQAYEQLLKSYFVLDKIDEIEFEYHVQPYGMNTYTQNVKFDKEKQQYFCSEVESDKVARLIVNEKGETYMINPIKKQYFQEKVRTKDEVFGSTAFEFDDGITQMMALLKTRSGITYKFQNGKFYMDGKVTEEDSHALAGSRFHFVSDEKTGFVYEITYTRDGKLMEQYKCTKVNFNPEFSTTFLPDISNYQKVKRKEIFS